MEAGGSRIFQNLEQKLNEYNKKKKEFANLQNPYPGGALVCIQRTMFLLITILVFCILMVGMYQMWFFFQYKIK